jgi:predicted nucleic acid-binding protein
VGPVVVDTGVFGADLGPSSKALADRYAKLLAGRTILISFITVGELRFGALRAKWGAKRLAALDDAIGEVKVVWPGDGLVSAYAELRAECVAAGHGLGEKSNEADRWVAATARFVGVPLVSDDGVFVSAPGIELLTAPPGGGGRDA